MAEPIVPPDVSRETRKNRIEDEVVASGTKLDEILEYAVTAAAEGLLQNAKALEAVNENLRRMKDSTRFHAVLLVIVLIMGGVIVYSLFKYTVPNSQLLVSCNTPSTRAHTHPCSDRQGTFGFNLSVAVVKCEKNLPIPVHTLDVKQCVASELGIVLDAALPNR